MKQLNKIFAGLADDLFYFLSFVGSIVALLLFPLLFLLTPVVLLFVMLSRFISFHKLKYQALEEEKEGEEVMKFDLSAQDRETQNWKSYKPPVIITNGSDLDYVKSDDTQPHVLIVEDDSDIARAIEKIFKRLGCSTTISNGHDGVSYKMSFQDFDFIVLDWVLGDDVQGNDVVQESVDIIHRFKNLRLHFENKHPKIITYSVLNRPQVRFPKNEYFYHLDHWNKPIKYSELATKASHLLAAYGYQGGTT
ncbi:MAG: response regulator [Pseudobdellovibrio sp.]